MLSKPRKLSPEFKDALELLKGDSPAIFITGKAGSGKSTLLRMFKKTTKKRSVVLAPTGVAALNAGGQTIHSFFGFAPHSVQESRIKERQNRKLYANLDTIIIDEVSMVRVDLLDYIDRFLRVNRRNQNPFGGCQMIFFGDLFQLPPIISTQEEKQYISNYFDSPHFFSAPGINQIGGMDCFELNKVYRQEEKRFLNFLNNIREDQLDEDDLEELNALCVGKFKDEEPYISLCSTNAKASSINAIALAKLEETGQFYQARITGVNPYKQFPADQMLHLKIGAQVMFLKNDPSRAYVNGTIGKIIQLKENEIMVSINDDKGDRIVNVERETWEIIKYKLSEKDKGSIEMNVVSSFTQFPLKLAWAITIHKSQGKTFDRAYIDLGRNAFAYGQTYVALSRCRTLNGLRLSRPLTMNDIFIDTAVVDFYWAIK